MDNTDCFLCQKSNCTLKCLKSNCNLYYCSDAHYSAHLVQISKKSNINEWSLIKPSPVVRHDKVINGERDNIDNEEGSSNQSDDSMEMYACLPYRICTSETLGRHFVATRDINPLELILVDQPGVVGPATNTRPVCLVCLNHSSGQFRYSLLFYIVFLNICLSNIS